MKVILGLLALTFVVFFGASDFGSGGFSGRQADTVVEVEKVSYSLNQVSKEFNKQILKTGFTINSLPDRMTKGFVVFSVLLTIITIFTRFSGSDIYLPDQWSLDTPHPIYGNETHIRVQFYSYWGLKKDNHRLHWDEVERWWYYNQKTTDLIDGVDSTYISQIQYYKIQ